MRSVLAKQELFNGSNSVESKNINIQLLSTIMKQTKYFSDISENEKMLNDKMKKVIDAMSEDKKIQIASVLETAKTDKDIKEDDAKLQDKIDKLVKLFDSSNSNIVKLFNEAKKQTKSFEKLTAASAKGIIDRALEQSQYKTLGERVSDAKESVKNFFTLKGFLNTTGIIPKESTGIFTNMVNRRQDKLNYIEDRKRIDPNNIALQGLTGKERDEAAAKLYGGQFEKQQELKVQMRANEKSIAQYRERGYNDAQIKRTGLLNTREELASQYAKVDPRVRDLVEKEVKPFGTSAASKEAQAEQQDLINDQVNILEAIALNTEQTNKLLQGLNVKAQESKQSEAPEGKGLFARAADVLGDIGIPGMGGGKTTGKTGGKVPGKGIGLGGKLLSGAKGFGIGTILGIGGDLAADALGRDTRAGGVASTLGETASYAGTGAMIGSVIPGVGTLIGAGIGGAIGLGKGLYDNWDAIRGPKVVPGDSNKMAQSIYGESAQIQSMKETGAASTAPVIVAPSTVNNTNTQVNRYDLPVRKNDDSLSKYTGSKFAY